MHKRLKTSAIRYHTTLTTDPTYQLLAAKKKPKKQRQSKKANIEKEFKDISGK